MYSLSLTIIVFLTAATLLYTFRQAWDLALDLCLAQLPGILKDGQTFQHSTFFAEQLTAFQVWLSYGTKRRNPPEQLPIVLQVCCQYYTVQKSLCSNKFLRYLKYY